MWKNIEINYVDLILIQCYTGFRPQELGYIELKNVDLEKGLIVGANKNNRIYPEAKHIFEADGTIKIDDIIYEFNIDLNFSTDNLSFLFNS